MSPRPGGEADKIGNRYERAWTVARLLDVFSGHVESIRVEPLGDMGKGVEFVLKRFDGAVEAHQVKRQSGNANEWNFSKLKKLNIWDAAKRHVDAGREYHFVSMVPFQDLRELTERARNSNDFASFIRDSLPSGSNDLFIQIGNLYDDQETAYRVLRWFYFRLSDEMDLRDNNAFLAQLLLEGSSGSQAVAALGELVDDNIDKVLTADCVLEALRPYELSERSVISRKSLADQVRAQTLAWSQRVGLQLLRPVIPQQEADQLRDIPSFSERVHFLVGTAGSGKTAVLQQSVEGLIEDGVPTLVMRLDRYEELTSTTGLGEQLGLDVSPVTALAAAADGRTSVLIIDQLDAVSVESGRQTENFDVVADLINEAASVSSMHIVLGCRQFDVDNDSRIRTLRDRLEAKVILVNPLSYEQVDAAVSALGLPVATLTRSQRDILQLPLHLTLLATVADKPDALDFASSQHLFDAYWDHKRQAVRQRQEKVRYAQAVGRLAEVISRRQELYVPISVLDDEDLTNDAMVLTSEHLLVRDGPKIAFFHEAMFDYAFARQWANRGESLVDFLTAGEQELFRRGQVRQIMTHLRAVDHARFIDEVHALLTEEQVRFHIQDAALTVLGALNEPSSIEADMVLEVSETYPELQPRMWPRLCSSAWFARLDTDGRIANWLRGEKKQQERALNMMAGVTGIFPDRLVELLVDHADAPSYPTWLRWVIRFAELGSNRPLFDLFVDAIKRGHYDEFEHDLWMEVRGLAEKHPDWVVEVLAALLIERSGALNLNARGQVAALTNRDHQAAELVRKAAAGAPSQFCYTLLPYFLQVMESTAYEHSSIGPRANAHFSCPSTEVESDSDLDDALFASMAAALRRLVATDPAESKTTLERLAKNTHEGAQYLLYQGILGNSTVYAEWAASLLLEGQHRFLCGYVSNSVWVTRELLQGISPYVSDELHGRLETEIRALRFPWERRRPGWYAFTLLSALDERRLSEFGQRRLGELQRAMGMEQPPEPKDVTFGWVGPPIPREAAQYMNDENWLQAMTKHASDSENIRTLKGGGREQAQVLREQTKQYPNRFGQLALRLSPGINPSYGDAILMGLGEAESVADEAVVFDAVRHIASFRHSENDRWLGTALRPYLKTAPLDIVELIRDRLVMTTDPSDDGVRVSSEGSADSYRIDLWTSGINTARGNLAETFACLLFYDVDGTRTALAVPVLDRLVQDPSVPVRTCVARLIGSAMGHARQAAIGAFWQLMETSDSSLLATRAVMRILFFLEKEDSTAVQSIWERMLASEDAQVREAGGQLIIFAAMEWDRSEYLNIVLDREDMAARKGAASIAAHHLLRTGNVDVAMATLTTLMYDAEDEVRKEAAEVASALRGHALRPFERLIKALVESPAFSDALPQLLITLEKAPDRIHDLALLCSRWFVEAYGLESGDIRTGAAADARQVGQLVIRGLAQTRSTGERAALLDVLDQLLLNGAYGIDELVSMSER